MQNHVSLRTKGQMGSFLACGLLGIFAICALHSISHSFLAQERDKEGMGVYVSGEATAEDVGLPIYAGSKPHKDSSDDSAAARLGLWGGGSEFKLAIVKMDTSDSPQKVAASYKKALAKYGKVLDCSNPSAGHGKADADDSSQSLTCGDDKAEKGGMMFKAGTRDRQHIVSVQPHGQGSFYQLLALGNWSKEGKN